MLTYVLFDLDDTLLDFKKSEAQALRQTLVQMGIEPTEKTIARYSAINQSQWELLEEGEITREQVLHRRFDILFGELGVERSSHATQEVYEYLLGQGHDFIPGAEELLEAIHTEYELYLVSNGTAAVQDSRLKATGIGRYFKGIFISERVGFDKPSLEYFDRCFAEMPEGARESAMIVGDSLTSDIRGGKNAGILTCWYNPHGKTARADICPDYEITALSELPALLKRL